MFWVLYDDEGQVIGTFDRAQDVADYLNITKRRVFQKLKQGDEHIYRFRASELNDEED